jgi:hypothetical protein
MLSITELQRLDKMRKEAIQVAATAMRFVLDICPPEKPGDGQ